MACEETDALHGQHIVELKTLQEVDIAADGGDAAAGGGGVGGGGVGGLCEGVVAGKLGGSLSDYTRQMAVSMMALHVTCPPAPPHPLCPSSCCFV